MIKREEEMIMNGGGGGWYSDWKTLLMVNLLFGCYRTKMKDSFCS